MSVLEPEKLMQEQKAEDIAPTHVEAPASKSSKVIMTEALVGLIVTLRQENGRLHSEVSELRVENALLKAEKFASLHAEMFEGTIRALGVANAELREANAALQTEVNVTREALAEATAPRARKEGNT